MLNFFRKGYPVQYISLFLFALLMWAPQFLNNEQNFFVDQPFLTINYHVSGLYYYLVTAFSFVILIASAMLVNVMAAENGFSGKLMSTGMLFYIILALSYPGFFQSALMLMVNLLIIFIFGNLFKLPESKNQISLIFDSSLLLGISSLIFFPAVYLLLIIWAGLLIHKSNAWRNYTASVFGLLSPYIFLFTWYYLTGQKIIFHFSFENLFNISAVWINQTSWLEKIIFMFIVILMIVAIFKIVSQQAEKNINLRRNLTLIEVGFVTTVLILLFFAGEMSSGLLLTAPAALLLSHGFYDVKKTKWYNVAFSLLLLLIIINRIMALF